MHVNFGLMPPLDPPVRDKRARYAAFASRGAESIAAFVAERTDLAFARTRTVLDEVAG